jgi:hypothetical protein
VSNGLADGLADGPADGPAQVVLLIADGRAADLAAALGPGVEVAVGEGCDASAADVIVARAASRAEVSALRRRFPRSALLVVAGSDGGASAVDAVGLLESGADALTVDPVLAEVSAYVRALLRRRPRGAPA